MSNAPHHQPFTFNQRINTQYINDLYEGDFEMIEETFAGVLHEYDTLLENIRICFKSGDISSLRSAIHKIKPLFGFVGLTSIQSLCVQFENDCRKDSFPTVEKDLMALMKQMTEAKSLIEEERSRLEAFNKAS
jgi:HPt (histidine-containing phosphotransfer) domain-containing protein